MFFSAIYEVAQKLRVLDRCNACRVWIIRGPLLEYDYSQVVGVQPIAATRGVCRDQLVSQKKPVKDKHEVAGTVAGAIIGGALGSKVGDGSGQDLATASPPWQRAGPWPATPIPATKFVQRAT